MPELTEPTAPHCSDTTRCIACKTRPSCPRKRRHARHVPHKLARGEGSVQASTELAAEPALVPQWHNQIALQQAALDPKPSARSEYAIAPSRVQQTTRLHPLPSGIAPRPRPNPEP